MEKELKKKKAIVKSSANSASGLVATVLIGGVIQFSVVAVDVVIVE